MRVWRPVSCSVASRCLLLYLLMSAESFDRANTGVRIGGG